MIHFQEDVVLHLAASNLNDDNKPIINKGDLILFVEKSKDDKLYIDYDTFFQLIDMYFEYTEHGTKANRTIKITGLLTRFQ